MKRLHMRKYIILVVFQVISMNTWSQDNNSRYLGINIFQIPALTINANYSIDFKPYLTPFLDLGFTPNYVTAYNIDYISFFLTPHCKCDNNGYDLTQQTGGYIKIGSYFNLRKSYDNINFFHFGIFLTNSVIYESGYYLDPALDNSETNPKFIEQSKFLIGFNLSTGYEFRLSERLKSHIDFQMSFPSRNYQDLFGYRNYIPGMGFKDTEDYWFPMLILNVKYRL